MNRFFHRAFLLLPVLAAAAAGILFPMNSQILLICIGVVIACVCWWAFSSFEQKRPGARQIVLMAVFTALAVVGRAALYMLPQVKPTAAVVILAGIAMGPESGFITGALSMLVSNCFFGQGPWTLWQMIAMGAVGFLAGVIFYDRTPRTWQTALFGFVSVTVIYGLIVDISTVLLMGGWHSALAVYGAAIPLNLIHGGGTAVFLFMGSGRLLKTIRRVMKKYGMNPR